MIIGCMDFNTLKQPGPGESMSQQERVESLSWLPTLKRECFKRLMVVVDNCSPLTRAKRAMQEDAVIDLVRKEFKEQLLAGVSIRRPFQTLSDKDVSDIQVGPPFR